MKRKYTDQEITLIKQLRAVHKPEEIASITGRTTKAIYDLLYKLSLKGIYFPKLRHKRLKYDQEKAQELRNYIRSGLNYSDIKIKYGIHPSIISRTLAAEIRGELKW